MVATANVFFLLIIFSHSLGLGWPALLPEVEIEGCVTFKKNKIKKPFSERNYECCCLGKMEIENGGRESQAPEQRGETRPGHLKGKQIETHRRGKRV